MSVRCYIALGSNLELPASQLRSAVAYIEAAQGIELVGVSRLYLSDPVGPEQPDYCNAAVAIDTALAPEALLDTLQGIEQAHGRVRSIRWGARTLDLDIALYGDQTIATERLIVPHKELCRRNFVLCPLADLAPELRLPNGQYLADLVAELGQGGLRVLGGSELLQPVSGEV